MSGLKRSFAAGAIALAVTLLASLGARADVTDVMREIERAGDARVIITMKTGDGRSAWEAARSVEQQRAVVADATERFARSMSAADIPLRNRFRTLPFAGARVNREQLLRLAAMPEVTGVHLVRTERKQQAVAEAPADAEHQSLANSVPSIDVPAAWAQGADGSGYAVAVIDGGFDLSHPMLNGKAIGDACFADSYGTTWIANCPSGSTPQIAIGAASNCPAGSTRCGHGTHVASIAAGNDGINFGVARGAKIVPIDVYSKDTDPADCAPLSAPCELTNSIAVLDALDYINAHAIEYHIAAVNYSGGGATVNGYCDDDPRKSVIDMLRKKGVAVVISAGNDSATGVVEKPACISSAVAVGATDNGTNVAGFSNFATTVDLMAPGVNIVAAAAGTKLLKTDSGTSMAAPHVAGAWAVLRSGMPNSTVDQIEDALKVTGMRVTRVNSGFTVPRIQVGRALDYMKGRGRQLFNQIVSSAGATTRGQSYLRIYNNSTAAGVIVATVRDVDSGAVLGKWTSASIPARAAPQFAIAAIEAAIAATAPQTFATRTAYNLELESSFAGYVQYLLLAPNAGVFANMTSCRDGLSAGDNTLLMNVNASSTADYISRLRVTNTGPLAGAAVLTFANAATGARIASWTSPSIASGASFDVAEPEVETAVPAIADAVKGGAGQFNVTLESLGGYLQHVIENRRAGALTDFTARCAVPASTGVVAAN